MSADNLEVSSTFFVLQSSLLLLIEPGKGYLFSVAWSPSRPLVIALSTTQGDLLMYDLQVSNRLSNLAG